jgi:hypothetical protein
VSSWHIEASWAAPHPISSQIRGGEAGQGFSLLGLRRHYVASSGTERIVFDIGDQRGQKLTTRPGYFQMVQDAKNSRVVLDLYQISASQMTPEEFIKSVKSSPLIKSARMLYDPEDRGLTLELLLNAKVTARAFEMEPGSSGARIVLDIKKDAGA